jgi:hypothetical protein
MDGGWQLTAGARSHSPKHPTRTEHPTRFFDPGSIDRASDSVDSSGYCRYHPTALGQLSARGNQRDYAGSEAGQR